ncbi:structural maintenance of chromosomes protein 4 isoform X1 [Pieris brassicae]|uniref:structural maintenance of chromosomes protein 4 isoform X1 n=2 Tax=Pieris brassicae TaxID=7116 RepID=UPI001E65F8D4|nr:structural maintenance of chromosomes protein 4 isoform X1 [Pieris brassicae]
MQISNKKAVDEPMDVDEAPSRENGENRNNDDEIDHISDDEEGGMRIGDIYIPPAPRPALTFDTTGPRLIITHILNENFKSYAGVQKLGPFHKSFTAIIGPNGSGKSNVIDSMLFVFGYRASKIRSKKISVLLHSSSKFPNVNSATVSVHFCQIIDGEGDEFTIVPNTEIVVSRTAFRDNSSFYTLNGRRVQFKEVARMLRSHGIDLDHNRFLILQGEVEQIAMMKPKGQNEHESGMLEYLEDIIGTSRYKEPIEKLNVKVEEYTEMRKDKLNRVRLVEQEKQRLEQPMREAVDLMELTNTALRTRNMLLQKYIHETNKIIESKTKELDELKKSLSKIDEQLAEVKQELRDKTIELKNGTQQYDDMQKKKDEIGDKLQMSKRKQVTVQADITQGNKKKNNLEEMLKTEKGKLIELELVPEKNKREITDCEELLGKHVSSKKQAEDELQTAMAGVREKTKGLQEQKDVLQSKLIELKKIVDEANKNFKLAESELKIYLSTELKETEKLERMREAYEKAVTDLEEKKTMRGNLSKSVPTQEKEFTQIKSRLATLRTEETSTVTEARALRGQLEESKQAMSANRSRGRVLDALMSEKRAGRLPGIFGRLGDLGGIDSKYDVAISTCCGALDNIVVDVVDTAQECVEFLKRNDIGRATFIALDKQQHLKRYYEKRCTLPENVPRLFDLVQVKDERVLPAFYYALRDTLVANELEQASRIAYGATRYRVVTLNGDVIEIAGTMSGGGKSVSRGRMSSSVQQDTSEQDPRVIQQAEEKLSRTEQRLSEIRSEQSTLEEKLSSLQGGVQEGKRLLHKLEIELNSLKDQVPNLQKQVQQQERKVDSCKVDEAQKSRLEDKVQKAEDTLNKAKNDAGEVEKEVHGIDAQIATVAGNKVKELQKVVEDLGKKIDKVNAEIAKLRVGINTSVRNAKKSKDKITQMETDLKDTEENLESLKNQKKQLTLDVSELQKEFEELGERITEGTSEFAGLRKDIVKLQEKENQLKSERLEANNAVSKMEKSIQDCTSKTPQWDRELKSLKLEDPGIEIPGITRPTPLVTHASEELDECSVDELRNRLTAQKARIGDNKPNLQAIQDFRAKEELYLKRAAELDEITTKRNEMRNLYDQLRKKRTTDFLSGFNTITTKLKEMYQMITLGGDAELELVDSLDPFTEGIIFSVRPPNKSWKNISNLSGGEKTLSSLALVFALHYYKPTPLYVMDEIDAALDFKNISIVANYIKERTKNAQFIIISLRYNMFEACNRLVGIYKTQDCTKSVTIENRVPEDDNFDNLINS